MAATFRVTGIETQGADLILSRLLPWGASGAMTLLSVTATLAPASGSVDNLLLDDPSTVRFAAADVRQPGFALTITVAEASGLWGIRFAGPSPTTWVFGHLLNGPAGSCALAAVKWLGADVLSPAPTVPANWDTPTTWEAKTAAGAGYWQSCAMSADGRVQLAARADSVQLSKDGGATWAATTLGDRSWYSCGVSADGKVLLAGSAGSSNSYLWLSKDGGVTWTAQTAAGSLYWRFCALSKDGKVLLAGGDLGGSGYLWLSKDGGETWAAQISAGARRWFQGAVSEDGQVLLASESGDSSGYVRVSRNGGATWSAITSAGAGYWYGCAMSPDGQLMLVGAYSASTANGYLQLSKDGGVTWTALTNAGADVWGRCAISADGRVILVGSTKSSSDGYLNLSVDGGVTWSSQRSQGVGQWNGCAVSADGRLLLAGVYLNSSRNLLLRATEDPIYIKPPLRTLSTRGTRRLSDTPPLTQGILNTAQLTTAKLLDAEFGGVGRIYGTVSRKLTPTNAPLRRRVRLHRSVDGYLARETWSKADGSYEFSEISTRYEWDVIAWDHELQEYSTVANNQLAEVIP